MQQVINIGAATGDGTGDKGQVPGIKVNANCTELYSNAVFVGTDSGAANAYVVSTFAPQPAAPIALSVGMMLRLIPGAGNGNTGPSTLNFAGTGVRNIVNSLGEALLGGEFVAGVPSIVIWNGTSWVQQLLSIAALLQSFQVYEDTITLAAAQAADTWQVTAVPPGAMVVTGGYLLNVVITNSTTDTISLTAPVDAVPKSSTASFSPVFAKGGASINNTGATISLRYSAPQEISSVYYSGIDVACSENLPIGATIQVTLVVL
jgi:hypothetical protein